MVEKRNWFDQGGQSYAQFRPAYPEALAAFFAAAAPATGLAVDVGCGNGQLTTLLARHFARVVGVDPSADQIAHAKPASGVAYAVARAEKLPLADGVASAVTAAQAAHWFDLPTFYAEVRRIARPGAVVALISYGVLVLEGGHLRHSEFTTRFGSPLRRDGSPRVVTVASSPLYERYRERFLHVIDSAVTPL